MKREAVLITAALVFGGMSASAGVASADPEPTPDPAPVPVTVIETDGTYSVGVDIVPGVYSTAGPVEGDACYWKRISATGGAIIDNAMSLKPQVVNIEATDLAFKSNGCQPWQLTPDAVAPPTPGTEMLPALISLAKLRAQLGTLNAGAGSFGLPPVPTP